jgi:RNA polymerase sigma-70 factor, ECF subfamily
MYARETHVLEIETAASADAPRPARSTPPNGVSVAARDAVSVEPHHPDAGHVSLLIAGDEAAWRVFHERYSTLMLDDITRVRRRFPALISADDARDIYAELCLQLLSGDRRRLRQFDPRHGTTLRSWLGVLARHAAFDFLRQRRRQPTLLWRGEERMALEALASDAPDAFGICAGRESARIVAALVESLSERDQEFVELYFYEGLDPEQTAERLGICVGTVYSKKHKIRARIESLLGKRQAA